MAKPEIQRLPIGQLADGTWFVLFDGRQVKQANYNHAYVFATKEYEHGRGQDRTEEARHYTG
jgi:hypothetical protein